MKPVDSVEHRFGVGAHRRCHARQRSGHILQKLECAFAAGPGVVGQRHHPDVGRGERPRLGLRAPGDALDVNLGPIRELRTDDAQLEGGMPRGKPRERGPDHLQIDEILRAADPGDGGRIRRRGGGRPVHRGVDGRGQDNDVVSRGPCDGRQHVVARGDHVDPPARRGEFPAAPNRLVDGIAESPGLAHVDGVIDVEHAAPAQARDQACLDGAQFDLMQHDHVGPPQEIAPLPGAQAIAPAREALGTHLKTGHLQGCDEAGHSVPIRGVIEPVT